MVNLPPAPIMRIRSGLYGLVFGVTASALAVSEDVRPQPEARLFTNAWELKDAREIPIERDDAEPFVVGLGPKDRLWIANQRKSRVVAFNDRGRERASASVSSRGPVTAIDFDRNDLMMVLQQRLHERWPMCNVRLYDDVDSSSRNITLQVQWGGPFLWAWESISEAIERARSSRRYNTFTRLTEPHLHIAAMNRKGSVYVAYPVLAEIEKFNTSGRIMARYNPSTIGSFTPVWLLCTRSGTVVAGDVENQRVIIMDQAGRVRRMRPCPGVETVLPVARPRGGWAQLNRSTGILTYLDNDGNATQRWQMPARQWCGLVCPHDKRLWLFDIANWSWLSYEHR